MAAKKIIKKVAKAPAKKAAPKLVKKSAPKKLVKKPAAKAPVRKLAPKPAAKPKTPAPKKAQVKKLAAPKKAAKAVIAPKKLAKPVVKLAAKKPTPVQRATPPKATPAKDPTKDYRNLRKYTHLKLEEIAQSVAEIRATIKSDGGDAPLAAWELTTYLAAIEIIVPDWKLKKLPAPDGKPRKRGRPSKADIAARSGAPMVLQTKAQATTAMAKVKTFVAKAGVPSLASPNITTGAALPVRPLLKLVPKLAPKLVSPAN